MIIIPTITPPDSKWTTAVCYLKGNGANRIKCYFLLR